MIDPIVSFAEVSPLAFAEGELVHLVELKPYRTFIAKVVRHSEYFGLTIFAYENGYTFRVKHSQTVNVVTNIEDWDSMSDDTRMDIELALMLRDN